MASKMLNNIKQRPFLAGSVVAVSYWGLVSYNLRMTCCTASVDGAMPPCHQCRCSFGVLASRSSVLSHPLERLPPSTACDHAEILNRLYFPAVVVRNCCELRTRDETRMTHLRSTPDKPPTRSTTRKVGLVSLVDWP